MFLLPFMIAGARARSPLPLRVADVTQASVRSGVETALPLDEALGSMTLTLVTVLDELHVAQPYQDDFEVELDGGVLRLSLKDDADVPAGVWTLILEPRPAEATESCVGCPAASVPTRDGADGADGSPDSGVGGRTSREGPFELKVRVPAARLVPVEPEVELSLVAPLAYDLLPEGVTGVLRAFLCPAGSYPQCVDSQVFLAFRELGDARRSCGWQATLEVERWGQGVSAEYPPRVSTWHREPSAGDDKGGRGEVPLEGLCIRPGEVGSFSFIPPDNIPLGRTDLRLLTRSVAAEEVPTVSVKLHVRRSMIVLVMVTIAGALLKLLHQLVIPGLRAAHARRRYLAEALSVVRTLKTERTQEGTVGSGDARLRELGEVTLQASLKRNPLSQAFWARGEQVELVGRVDAALQGLAPLLAANEQTDKATTPSLPKAPDLTLQPLGPLLLETFLGLVVLVFFVYVTYAPVFVGTLPELAGIFTFAYAANLGLENLMQGLGERFGARTGQGTVKEEPTGRS